MRSKSQSEIIFDRTAALLALICTAVYDYGMRIVMLVCIAAAVSLLTERLCLYAQKKPFTRKHLDAAVSGVILLMLMPPTVPVSLLIMSCIFGNIIGRQLFGGRENPVMPVPAVGYLFAMLNNRAAMTAFPAKKISLPLFSINPETLTNGLTERFNRFGKLSGSVTDWLTGIPAQPIGTGSIVLLVVIAIVLMLRRSASPFVLLPIMITTAAGNLMLSDLLHPFTTIVASFLTNQLLFSAIFLYADTDYAPPTVAGAFSGMFAGSCMIFFTRFLYVYDAPVILAVLLSPVMIWMRAMMQKEESKPEGGIRHERRKAHG